MRSEALLTTVGLVCLLTMFVTSGIHKVRAFDATVGPVHKKLPALPLPPAAAALVILLEILAPLVVLGARFLAPPHKEALTRVALGALAALVVVVTLVYHPLRVDKGYMANLPFFSNLSVLGGLLVAM